MADNCGMSRRGFLGALAAGSAVLARGASAEPLRKPNVIFAFADEHRWHSTSFTEQPELRTPNMARMAAEGAEFRQCISNYPVCSPYRGMLMTGRWPFQTGVTDNDLLLKESETTVAEVFREAGYRTGYIGKWHLGGVRTEPHGFDLSLVWTGTVKHRAGARYHPANGEPIVANGYNATLMTDQALRFVEENRETPFLLFLSWDPPHSEFKDAPDAKKALYPEGSLPRRPNVPKDSPAAGDKAAIWDQNDWANFQGYNAHISAIDDELGRIMAKLEELGLTNDTILVYSSDHGSMMGSHGVGGKRQPHEESIRVPLLVRCPGRVPAGRREDGMVGTIDLAPTLCGLAGIPQSGTFVGRDVSPSLQGLAIEPSPSQFVMHIAKEHASGGENHPAPLFRGVRTVRHTYAVCSDGPGFLFDNREGPYQMRNLYETDDAKELRKELRTELARWLKKAEDPFRLPEG